MGVGRRSVARVIRATLAGALATACAVAVVSPAGAAPTSVKVVLTLNHGSIRADGHSAAALHVSVTKANGAAVANATVKLTTKFVTSSSFGSAHVPASATLDAKGAATVNVTATRSGKLTITASINTAAYAGSTSISLRTRRHSIVVFADGASSFVKCSSPGKCDDANGALFNPVRSALTAKGFKSADFATFSYTGGVVDAATKAWIPKASVCADSGTSYLTEVGRMNTMLQQIATANPNSDFSLVGLSQGGLLVFQMLATATTLPMGSRLASVSTFDAPLGGGALDLILQIDQYITPCWGSGGTSPAAQQLVNLWNTTAPTQGPRQADHATLMCELVAVAGCHSETNQAAVAAVSGVVAVKTWGSSQDALYDPAECSIAGTFSDARDSQTVTGAGGGMHAEGAPPGPACPLTSHVNGLLNHTADIVATIKAQQ